MSAKRLQCAEGYEQPLVPAVEGVAVGILIFLGLAHAKYAKVGKEINFF